MCVLSIACLLLLVLHAIRSAEGEGMTLADRKDAELRNASFCPSVMILRDQCRSIQNLNNI